ncbi:hypothetical protein EVAR_84380_1 [Eumeta japonica]|uniref:Uncharacterized protein n=1 Tax=Eumeta variegata TaxID=151549 RepID=A0A4C1U4E0_EUMVA|nr:hypothetical protein EVAR_84380_1 [Eumeta japonica]
MRLASGARGASGAEPAYAKSVHAAGTSLSRVLFSMHSGVFAIYKLDILITVPSARGGVRPLSLFYSDASADGVEER